MLNKSIFEKEKPSLWLKDGIFQKLPSLKSNQPYDICIVGFGITYITTVKFTFQHDIIYSKIIKNYGLKEALLYYEAQVQGMEFVRNIITDYNIQCDFKHSYAMIYADSEDQFKEIEMEYWFPSLFYFVMFYRDILSYFFIYFQW